MKKKIIITLSILSLFVCAFLIYMVFSQVLIAHRHSSYSPSYEKVDISEILDQKELTYDDYEILFKQTGLGPKAVDLLMDDRQYKEKMLEYQDIYFLEEDVDCVPLLGWFTREDQKENTPAFTSIQSGDIFVSLSTHTLGWRHGHIAIALNENYFLESTSLGSPSTIVHKRHLSRYSNFALLRSKDENNSIGQAVAAYAYQNLYNVPYRLFSGLFGRKYINKDTSSFGGHCSYLVWYAFASLGIDLDSSGGSIVTPRDILKSDQLDLIQIYGINPILFLK